MKRTTADLALNHRAAPEHVMIVVAVAAASALVVTEVDHVTADVAVDHVNAAEIADEIATALIAIENVTIDNATTTETATGKAKYCYAHCDMCLKYSFNRERVYSGKRN